MEITHVEIVLPWSAPPNFLAYCSVELDGCLVVHGLRLIGGGAGRFVAMPSKKMTDRCPGCAAQNAFDARYCDQCGRERPDRPAEGDGPKGKGYRDIAHPITSAFREQLNAAVCKAYEDALARMKP